MQLIKTLSSSPIFVLELLGLNNKRRPISSRSSFDDRERIHTAISVVGYGGWSWWRCLMRGGFGIWRFFIHLHRFLTGARAFSSVAEPPHAMKRRLRGSNFLLVVFVGDKRVPHTDRHGPRRSGKETRLAVPTSFRGGRWRGGGGVERTSSVVPANGGIPINGGRSRGESRREVLVVFVAVVDDRRHSVVAAAAIDDHGLLMGVLVDEAEFVEVLLSVENADLCGVVDERRCAWPSITRSSR